MTENVKSHWRKIAMTEGENFEEVALTPEEQAANAAFEKRRAETRAWVDLLLEKGYRWNPAKQGELIHPNDKDLNAFHDQYEERLFFSPKLQEQLTHLGKQMKGESEDGAS